MRIALPDSVWILGALPAAAFGLWVGLMIVPEIVKIVV
jgi:hypothetical protein